MYSRSHAIVSALVGIPLVIAAPVTHQPSVLYIFIVGLGTGIDFDHFIIGRINRGDWANLWRCIRDPSRVFVDQSSIFEAGDIWRDQRLLSHHLIGGVLVTLLWTVSPYWAFVTAVTVYVHILADLYSDIQTRDEYLHGHR